MAAAAKKKKKKKAVDAKALRRLGDSHYKKQDHVKALAFWLKAAEAGDDDSAQNAAYLLRTGEGVRDDVAYRRFLDRMVAEGRAWAVKELEGIEKARELERLREARIVLPDEDKLRELTTRFELVPHFEGIRAAARLSILLLGRRAEDGALAVGASKLGGDPDLPAAYEWPSYEGKPLAFLGQIEIAEMQRVLPDRRLPGTGQLAFFYDDTNQPWGSPDEQRACRVAFTSSAAELVRRKAPEGVSRIEAFALEAHLEMTLPYPRTVAARGIGFDQPEFARYVDLFHAYANEYCRQPAPKGDVHRFLGHPDALQGDMSRRLEYALRGKDIEIEDPEIEAAAREWVFLFQVGSDFNQGLNWGDNGRLFFWIREADLLARRFDAVAFQLQCH